MTFRATRREFLEAGAAAVFAAAAAPWLASCGDSSRRGGGSVVDAIDPRSSPFGVWTVEDGLPVFVYDADHTTIPEAEWDPIVRPRTHRHWHMFGNRALQVQADNDGTLALFDESGGLRWLTAADPRGTGVSRIHEEGGVVWSTDFAERAGESVPERVFGPSHFEVRDRLRGLEVRRTVLCPEGEVPWLLVRVALRLDRRAGGRRSIRHVERWDLRPRFVNLFIDAARRRETALREVRYEVGAIQGGLQAAERFASADGVNVFGPPATLVLQALGATTGSAAATGEPHPTLEITTPLELAPGEELELFFRFGREDPLVPDDPEAFLVQQRRSLRERLPRAAAPSAPEAAQEIPWHAAVLTGGASVDRVIGGHTLDQASTYSFEIGLNAAARDPLQHALPLVYTEPDLALSVLRNTCAWATPEGDLPYSLDGAKNPFVASFRPSDSNLWALWLAAEYAAATGDLAAFDAPLAYHPRYGAAPAPLREHLRRQFRFFVDVVGRGERNHVRILNADWNDRAIEESGVEREIMIERGSSVLNSAMGSWVLGVFAGLAERLGEGSLALEARQQADELRALVASAWNGRWFHRAYAPGGAPIGDDDCWLEVQPWAVLCGAAPPEQARALLAHIDANHRAGSPVGTRVKWPADPDLLAAGIWGLGTLGGTWFAVDMTLVWAAASVDPALAWDAWRRMTLGAHTAAYPDAWEGTLSGPDSWNGPESPRAGRTWVLTDLIAMQAFPVANLHSHAQPILAYLRVLGVEPKADGTLAVGAGGRFASPRFTLEADGHGRLTAAGEVTVASAHGVVRGAGELRW
jgi:hypothetical protein